MEFRVFSLFLCILALILTEVKCISDVPAILWNIKGDALDIKPVSAFEVGSKKFTDNLLKESLNEKSTSLLVFLVDELSLEDLSSEPPAFSDSDLQHLGEFFDTHPHMLLPHVQDPLKRLHNVHCEKEELHLEGKFDQNSLQIVSAALDRSCTVILNMQKSEVTEMGKTRVDVAKDVLSSLSTSRKNIIGMFTAVKSSWSSSEHQHKSRSLLAEDADKPETAGHLFNHSGCIIMYATNITITNGGPDITPSTVIVPFTDVSVNDSGCNATASTAMLEIKFDNVKGYSVFTIRMTFGKKRNLWSLSESEVTIKNSTEGEQHTERTKPSYTVEAPMAFSYSCGQLIFETINSTVTYTITVEGFQIQPYDVKKTAFDDSFDCVPFFTLPIWMGLIVGILFIIILNTGVYALFAVKTMDRFDDPKGKTISVAFSAD